MKHSQTDITTRISERQMRMWNVLHSAQQAHPVIAPEKGLRYRFITLSRDDGSLGDAIAIELANRLGWHVFDKEIVDYIAKNNRVREDLVRQLDEKNQGIVYEAILRLLRMPEGMPFGSEEYHESLLKTLATLAARGAAVLVGRGANFALRESPDGLHVRITGSLEVRLRRESERQHLPAAKARLDLVARDAERRHFIRHLYGKDYDDPRYYHLTFNTDHLSVEQVTNAIISAANPEISVIETQAS